MGRVSTRAGLAASQASMAAARSMQPADLVLALEQHLSREGVDLEGDVLVARQMHDLRLEIDGDLGFRLGSELVEELTVRVLVHDDRQQAVLERVAAEDVGEAGRDDGPDAPRRQRPGRVLAR